MTPRERGIVCAGRATVQRTGREHRLKIDPVHFDAVHAGRKNFELRFNDRRYAVGDLLILHETRHGAEEMREGAPLEFTGRSAARVIQHLVSGPQGGLVEGWVILSFASPA